MVTITIDEREIQAVAGKTILEVAGENGIEIPTLSKDARVASCGTGHVAMVEITTVRGTRLVAASLYNVQDGLSVQTKSDRVTKLRRAVIESLWSRCPDSPVITNLARQYGVVKPITLPGSHGECNFCGVCARVCEKVVGVSAITLASRGDEWSIDTPDFGDDCIGCGSCAYSCPTHAISFEDNGDTRTVSLPHVAMMLKLRKCAKCGKYWAPERQLAYIAKIAGLYPEEFEVCPDCRE